MLTGRMSKYRQDWLLFFVISGGIIVSVVTTIVRIRAIVVCLLHFPFGLLLFVGGFITLLCIEIFRIFIVSVGWSFWITRSPLRRGTIIYLAVYQVSLNCYRKLHISQ